MYLKKIAKFKPLTKLQFLSYVHKHVHSFLFIGRLDIAFDWLSRCVEQMEYEFGALLILSCKMDKNSIVSTAHSQVKYNPTESYKLSYLSKFGMNDTL